MNSVESSSIDFKILNTKLYNKNCWFCEKKCNSFVSICVDCKKEKIKKKIKIDFLK